MPTILEHIYTAFSWFVFHAADHLNQISRISTETLFWKFARYRSFGNSAARQRRFEDELMRSHAENEAPCGPRPTNWIIYKIHRARPQAPVFNSIFAIIPIIASHPQIWRTPPPPPSSVRVEAGLKSPSRPHGVMPEAFKLSPHGQSEFSRVVKSETLDRLRYFICLWDFFLLFSPFF